MKRDITILDLFSGIGGFSKAFQQAGYNIKKHYFSEIDKHAIAVYQHNFKNSEYVGSVTDVPSIEKPDVITFGSPCQDFSLAGKRLGMGGERSSLITEAIRLISHYRPGVFIWENVKGAFSSNDGADFWAIIQAFANIGGYRLEWQLLNTAWFLPQNRERIYLVGHLGKGSGKQVFPIGEGFGVSEKSKGGEDRERQICSTITSNLHKGVHNGGETYVKVGDYRTDEGFREREDGNCPTLQARARNDGSGQPILKVKSGIKQGYEEAREGDIIDLQNPNSDTRKGRVSKDRVNTLDTACNQAYWQKEGIRRLTPIECERLQGFPDNWTKYGNYDGVVKEVSDSQRYKMCGNAVTVNVVEEIAKRVEV